MVKKRKINIYVILILVLTLFITNHFINPTGKAIHEPATPENCTDSNITAVWETIFNIPAEYMSITNNDDPETPYCDSYVAVKINDPELFLLYGSEINSKEIIAIHGNFSDDFMNQIEEIEDILVDKETTINNLISNATARTPPETISEAASLEFSQVFKGRPTLLLNGTTNIFEYKENENDNFIQLSFYSDKMLEEYYFYKACIPNWTEQLTTCNESELQTKSYEDSNECGNDSDKPENETIACDYNTNNLLGKISNAVTSRVSMKIEIGEEELNDSEVYEGEKPIEIYDDNDSIIEFDWNFNEDPLNLFDIEIEKQSSSSSFGYLVIKGIDSEKIVKVDKLDSDSNSVCIRDSFSADIDDISDDCDGNNEYIVPCPGTDGTYACTISSNKFIVSGLEHSVIKEFTDTLTTTTISSNTTSLCVPIWNCTTWSDCTLDTKTRICTDTNNCNNNSGKPSESESCETTASCTPSWTCTDWNPTECPSSKEQTRTCSDSNSCGSTSGKPLENQTCTYEKSSSATTIIVIIILIILGVGGFLVFRFFKKGPSTPGTTTPMNSSLPPSPPTINRQPMMRKPMIRKPIPKPINQIKKPIVKPNPPSKPL